MTAFREALKAQIEDTLRCPKCPAWNRPGATVIEIEIKNWTACCAVCGHAGAVETFQPKEN